MEDLEFRRLIEQYQRGLLSGKQKALMDEWFDSLAAEDEGVLPDFERSDIKERILEQIVAEPVIAMQGGNRGVGKGKSRLLSHTLRVAASVALLATTSYIIFTLTMKDRFDEMATLQVAASGSIKKVVLMDGSIVWLKERSTLTYPETFGENKRMVTLEGEALFEVAKDSLSPFIIQCGELFTTVIGTSFNIKLTEENIEVVVLTGKVSLTSKNDKKGVIVLPNEKAMYSVGSRQIAKAEKEVEKEEATAAISGTQYKMDFKDTRMKEVIKRIEGKFSVVVKTDDPKLLNCMITADFSGQSLERTLDMIAMVLAFDFEIMEGAVVLRGAGCPQ